MLLYFYITNICYLPFHITSVHRSPHPVAAIIQEVRYFLALLALIVILIVSRDRPLLLTNF